jgi:EAL domain-containing protein (putative c-di-GMP-specific phosphodiesterase class I)
MGVSMALDDFGTGYSSLSYLQQLPIDVLKIDKSFMDKLLDGNADPVLVKAIVDLGTNLRLGVVAEGIETFGQMTQLKGLGCDLGQGFYFDRAVSPGKILGYLNREETLSSVQSAEIHEPQAA